MTTIPDVRRALRGRVCVLLGCALLALPAVAGGSAGAAERLPDAAQVIARFIEATGGQAAHDALRNHVIRGTVTLPAQQISLAITLVQARTNLVHAVLESPAIGRIESGVDGSVAWELSTTAGPRIKEGVERSDALRDATFDPWGNWRKVHPDARVTGIDTLAGRPCYHVELAPADGRARTAYFDRESGLLQRIDHVVQTPGGAITTQNWAGDYRKAGGVLLAHRAEIVVAGQKRVMTLDSVAVNVDLPADEFAPPAEVKKLLEAKKQAP